MADATTGTSIANSNRVLSRISSVFQNVRKLSSDPAVQKSIPLAFELLFHL